MDFYENVIIMNSNRHTDEVAAFDMGFDQNDAIKSAYFPLLLLALFLAELDHLMESSLLFQGGQYRLKIGFLGIP